MPEDMDAQPPADNPSRPRRKSRKANKGQGRVLYPIPKLLDEDLQVLAVQGARQKGRSQLRAMLLSVLKARGEIKTEHFERLPRAIGSMARAGRDLAEPLEASRHHMLRYFEQVLCGYEFSAADPMHAHHVKNAWTRACIRLIRGWQKQIERYLEKHAEHRLTVAEAMGMPDDEDDGY